jgi:IMP dehydrogenase
MRTTVSLSYEDVLLVPQYSDVRSRKEIDIGTTLGEGKRAISLGLPIISSPMDTVTGPLMSEVMNVFGGVGVIHRYCTIEDQAKMVKMAKLNRYHSTTNDIHILVGAAVGVTGDFEKRAYALKAAGVDFLCIDIAHGHHILMREAIETLRCIVGDDKHIMAGNVATLEGVNALADWGADSVRCNIGGGSICSTRIQTGHGMPGLQTIMECVKTDRNVSIIADGGIRNSGDVVKALAAGADCVMVGSMLAGTAEAPGEILHLGAKRYKNYRGMASEEAQKDWRGTASSLEGISATIPYKGSVTRILEQLDNGIRSGFSYSGARTLPQLQSKAKFTRQTAAGISESNTHILSVK